MKCLLTKIKNLVVVVILTKAAVTYEKGQEFQFETIQIDEPTSREVMVRMVATSICHTDLSSRNQYLPVPFPVILGHEGAGVVEKVGDGVTKVKPGDHVVMSFASCGSCPACLGDKPYGCEKFSELNFFGRMADGSSRLHQQDGQDIGNFFGQSSFACHVVVAENNLVPVPNDIPLELLAPLGCGIQTGSGAVLNKLKPKAGSSIVVFGTGAVGLSAIMAAKVAKCTTIIAVDINEKRLELAKELGATHVLNGTKGNITEAILQFTNKGINYSVDTTGRPEVVRQAIDSLAPLGVAVLIGAPQIGTEVKLDINALVSERTVTGVLMGSGTPQTFIPKLIELYKQGDFPFDRLIKFYSMEELNQAAEDSENGITVKPVIKLT